jgi:hypothetical protein
MIKIVRSSEHFHHKEDWLSTYWHFSFDFYRDPANMGFGPLRVFNDDIIEQGKGFGFHPHRDMEIVTFVIEGELEHRDNHGNHGVIKAGEVQRMTAGTGIVHSEYNHSQEKELRLLQMWIFADRRGLEPSWEQKRFSREERKGKLLPIVVPWNSAGSNGNGAVRIHQDATFYVSSLDGSSKPIEHDLQGHKAYFFVIDGSARLNDKTLEKRDAARIVGENKITISADDNKSAEIMLIDLPERFVVNG